MSRRVEPKVFIVGYTIGDIIGIQDYLEYTGQMAFLTEWQKALKAGISSGEALCSLYAKLCYKSLIVGKNDNIEKTRDIKSNLENCFNTAHGSVFEHCSINFIVTDCSRVYTHEQVRHRSGMAYSQTSGRYCLGEDIDIVLDPILEPVMADMEVCLSALEFEYRHWCARLGLYGKDALRSELAKEVRPGVWENPSDTLLSAHMQQLHMDHDGKMSFDRRKKVTSALRRMLPNGQANEIGMTANIRALRHLVQVRTHRAAEWEIRHIFNQVYQLVKAMFPMIFYQAKEIEQEGLLEVYGMKANPYEITADDPRALQIHSTEAMANELDRRTAEAPGGA